MIINKTVYVLLTWAFLLPGLLLFSSGCSSTYVPSDDEAIRLVKSYYLFSRGGKEIEATVHEKGAYEDECDCYPVKYSIEVLSTKQKFLKTFYLFRNDVGVMDIREYKLGIKK